MPDHSGFWPSFVSSIKKAPLTIFPGGPEVLRISQKFLKTGAQMTTGPISLGHMRTWE